MGKYFYQISEDQKIEISERDYNKLLMNSQKIKESTKKERCEHQYRFLEKHKVKEKIEHFFHWLHIFYCVHCLEFETRRIRDTEE